MDHTLSGAAALVVDEPAQLFVTGTGALHDVPSFLGSRCRFLVLAGAAMRRPRATFLAVVALTALAYACGTATPVYGWLHHLPPLDHFRAPIKLQALVELALAWGAALGFDAVLHARVPFLRALALGLALAAGVERAAYLPASSPRSTDSSRGPACRRPSSRSSPRAGPCRTAARPGRRRRCSTSTGPTAAGMRARSARSSAWRRSARIPSRC